MTSFFKNEFNLYFLFKYYKMLNDIFREIKSQKDIQSRKIISGFSKKKFPKNLTNHLLYGIVIGI
ncbi:hypothetical protein CRD36_10340 [Paremcibacter congregatus]|uniref:Uncharacterized protein n=1 Tax=Paremcibacter congregatus TaxID=2043170 RepID=A0A2G4YQT5_9PROT|nr:hypothetical protein CRD36_10340 [Paremcibacter congregatus]